MFSRSFRIVTGVCCLFLLLPFQATKAGELIIHDGGSLTVNTDSTLLMNCNDFTIESGGSFTLDGGAVESRGRLILEGGGVYTIISGTVDKCYNLIPGPLFLLLLDDD